MTINWPDFLAPHDMLFPSPPKSWHEAPHFGNAMIGSMLYMRNDRLCLEIFRADVHDHRDESYGWTAYSRPRLKIGCFQLETPVVLIGCQWRKDLWNAELTGSLTTDGGDIRIRHFVHAEDMAIVTELEPEDPSLELSWSWQPAPAETERPGYPANEEELQSFARRYGDHYKESLQSPTPNPPGHLKKNQGVHVWTQNLLAGGQYATAWTEKQTRGTRAHIVTTANTFPENQAGERAAADIAAFVEKINTETGLSDWIDTHRTWWHAYYPRSFVSIPDKKVEALYWQTIYRYGCLARAGRTYVDTAGLWFQGGNWPYTTNDWNTQSAHWGLYAANRLEQSEEILNRLYENRQNLIDAVYPEEWREDSAYLHLATAMDMAGTRISDMRYYDCVGCLPWLLHNAWWQYRFSMDDEMLREKVFPLLRRAVNLYLHLIRTDEDGTLHLKPTYSPETGTYEDCNFDLALLKWGCHILLKICRLLQLNDPLQGRWREVTERLVDFPADEHGFILGNKQPPWKGHRHLSHLMMIYPLYLVNTDQPGAREILERSADDAWDSNGSDGGQMGNLHAMVQTHCIPLQAALGRGKRALEGLRRLQSELHPNGLWSCGVSPCIESTVSVVNCIQEMLIQSWADPALEGPSTLRVFPALPSAWADAEFHNLRAEGAFLVSAKRVNGQTVWVRIESLAGETCRVKPGFEGDFQVSGDRDFAYTEVTPGLFDLDLKKGETATLASVNA